MIFCKGWFKQKNCRTRTQILTKWPRTKNIFQLISSCACWLTGLLCIIFKYFWLDRFEICFLWCDWFPPVPLHLDIKADGGASWKSHLVQRPLSRDRLRETDWIKLFKTKKANFETLDEIFQNKKSKFWKIGWNCLKNKVNFERKNICFELHRELFTPWCHGIY